MSEVLDNMAHLQTNPSLHATKFISLCENSAQRPQRDSDYRESSDEEYLGWMQLDKMPEEGYTVKLTAQNALSKHFDAPAAKDGSEKLAQANKKLVQGRRERLSSSGATNVTIETSTLHTSAPPAAEPVSIAAAEDSDKAQTALAENEVSKQPRTALHNPC